MVLVDELILSCLQIKSNKLARDEKAAIYFSPFDFRFSNEYCYRWLERLECPHIMSNLSPLLCF